MNKFFIHIIMIGVAITLSCCEKREKQLVIQQLEEYQTPDTCFNKGVSAPFSGISNNHLILAGGCNFPHVPAAQGGQKVFYDYIWATPVEKCPDTDWKLVGRLPIATAYGVSLPYSDGMLCIGGIGPEGEKLRNAYFIHLINQKIEIKNLPDLPFGIDNAYGCIENSHIYIVGGNADGVASNLVVSLALDSPESEWEIETVIPQDFRVQPVCALVNHEIYVFGGYSPKTESRSASMPQHGLKYDIQKKEWNEINVPISPDGEIIALAGGAAITDLIGTHIICVGGVNQDIFPKALNGELAGPSYMEQPIEWYKFNRYILSYDVLNSKWDILGENEAGARAGACLVSDGDWYYIINGELKPGIRTPMISRFKML